MDNTLNSFNLIICEISLQLKWSKNCIILAVTVGNRNPTFQINDTKLYVPVVNLCSQENIKTTPQTIRIWF